jgi:hypothetical protein
LGVPVDSDRIRMVTHLDVSRADIDKAVVVTKEVIKR